VTDLAAVARGAGFAHVAAVADVQQFETVFLEALRRNELSFILAKVEPGIAKVPPAGFDSQENKYAFVRYIEKTENLRILISPPSRGS
jgi:thiamine pyrophosphate-dependent acetolactate synthase large subunit-like protein